MTKESASTPSAKPRLVVRLFRLVARLAWFGLFAFLIGFPLFMLSVRYNTFNLYGGMPSMAELARPSSELASELYAADGTLLGKYYRENRSPVTPEELIYLPDTAYLVNALVATEDARFQKHPGIDLRGLARAAVFFAINPRRAGGASTITQQLSRNLFALKGGYPGKLTGTKLGTIIRKAKEWVLAANLERQYTKDELITMYFNTVSFGNNTYGIKTAANVYFNREPWELEAHQAALLVGMVNNQTLFNPLRRPELTQRRRNWVLSQMDKYGYITEGQKTQAIAQDLGLQYRMQTHNRGLAPYFRNVVKGDLRKWVREVNKGKEDDEKVDLYGDGLRIYTTLDPKMQGYAERAVKEHMTWLQARFYEHWSGRKPWRDENGREIKDYILRQAKRTGDYRALKKRYPDQEDSVWARLEMPRKMTVFSWKGDVDTVMSTLDSIAYYKYYLHAGFMAMDPETGAVKAWVGGINNRYFQYDHVRQGQNQPGSTFKAFVYATAIENGYSPCYEVQDKEVTYNRGKFNEWTPKNATRKWDGKKMTLRQAMGRSVNRIAAQMMYKIHPENVVSMAQRLGISSELQPLMSLSLGTMDVSLFDMVGAYGAFVNQGIWIEPHFITRIEDKNGTVLYEKVPQKAEVLNPQTAYLMTHMLQGATREVGGTARRLHKDILDNNEVGGKTGTTSDYADGWFMGITHNMVAGAWVGGDDRTIRFRSFQYGQGAVMALPIWENFMLQVYRDKRLNYPKGNFPLPPGGVNIELDCGAYGSPADTLQAEDSVPEIDFDEMEGGR